MDRKQFIPKTKIEDKIAGCIAGGGIVPWHFIGALQNVASKNHGLGYYFELRDELLIHYRGRENRIEEIFPFGFLINFGKDRLTDCSFGLASYSLSGEDHIFTPLQKITSSFAQLFSLVVQGKNIIDYLDIVNDKSCKYKEKELDIFKRTFNYFIKHQTDISTIHKDIKISIVKILASQLIGANIGYKKLGINNKKAVMISKKMVSLMPPIFKQDEQR